MGEMQIDDDQRELLMGFVEEAREMLDEVEPYLIELEILSDRSGEVDPEVINTIFRLFHSFKGGAGFLDLETIQRVAHVAETLLDLFRKNEAELTSDHIDLLNRTCDFLRNLIEKVETNYTDRGFEVDADFVVSDLQKTIDKINSPPVFELDDPPDEESSSASTASTEPDIKIPDFLPDEPQTDNEESEPEETPNADVELPNLLDFMSTPEIAEQFTSESVELLESAEEALLNLEQDPENADYVSQAFRAIHSFKGNAGFLGLGDLERLSHQEESVLEKIRAGDLKGDSALFSLLLQILDFLRVGVNQVSEGTWRNIPGLPGLISLLKEAVNNSEDISENIEDQVEDVATATKTGSQIQDLKVDSVPEQTADKTGSKDNSPSSERRKSDGRGRRISDKLNLDADKVKVERRTTARRQSVRVDVEKLDVLLDMVGELVIAEAMVAQNPDIQNLDVPLDQFEKSVMQLGKITRDLQEIANSIRMIQLSGTFKRMIRLVRDVSQKAGKKVDLDIIGEETEVDKTVIEQITDPLIHIIRNSIDHGIETPDQRKENGKGAIGHLSLEAKYVGGEVWILIVDDGKGLDRQRILSKAVEKGLILKDPAEMRDEEVWQLIFQPGFSTAEKITDVSGRGVGMDVVRRNIENIRGKVDIQSTPLEGTTVVLRIPLTLAIIDGMIVRVGNTNYTIPTGDIQQSFQVLPHMITRTMDDQEVVRLRDKLHPVVRLHEFFNVEADNIDLTKGILILVENNHDSLCLFVDEVLGQQQVVIKGIPEYAGSLSGISGCTILGDGSVCLIMDISGLIKSVEKIAVDSLST